MYSRQLNNLNRSTQRDQDSGRGIKKTSNTPIKVDPTIINSMNYLENYLRDLTERRFESKDPLIKYYKTLNFDNYGKKILYSTIPERMYADKDDPRSLTLDISVSNDRNTTGKYVYASSVYVRFDSKKINLGNSGNLYGITLIDNSQNQKFVQHITEAKPPSNIRDFGVDSGLGNLLENIERRTLLARNLMHIFQVLEDQYQSSEIFLTPAYEWNYTVNISNISFDQSNMSNVCLTIYCTKNWNKIKKRQFQIEFNLFSDVEKLTVMSDHVGDSGPEQKVDIYFTQLRSHIINCLAAPSKVDKWYRSWPFKESYSYQHATARLESLLDVLESRLETSPTSQSSFECFD